MSGEELEAVGYESQAERNRVEAKPARLRVEPAESEFGRHRIANHDQCGNSDNIQSPRGQRPHGKQSQCVWETENAPEEDKV